MNRRERKLDSRIRWMTRDIPEDDSCYEYAIDRERQRDFERWQKKAKPYLPDLARRVFALRDKMYSGCGFHYVLEARLGGVIHSLNHIGRERLDYIERLAERMHIEMNFQSLFREVVKIEKEIQNDG
jgi:hypothetical protein